jgi:hypothetical protein
MSSFLHKSTSTMRSYRGRLRRLLLQSAGYFSQSQRPGFVVMLHIGRCGSTVLADALAQHSKIFWDGKLHRKAHGLYGENVKKIDHERWIKRQSIVSGSRFYGFEFKILEDQYPRMIDVSLDGFLDICRRVGVTHYIVLRRRNTLRHVLSHYASKSRGRWHYSVGENVWPSGKFTLDLDRISTGASSGVPLCEYLHKVESVFESLERLLNERQVLHIEYEADIDSDGPEVAYKKICRFLEIQPEPFKTTNRKIESSPMHNRLMNYASLVSLLSGTKYEWMLEIDSEH